MLNRKQRSESFFMGAVLAIVGGFLDTYTYILRGGVFANAQTGNIVLFGLNLAERNIKRASSYLIPVFAFVLGILLVEVVKYKFAEMAFFHWRQIIVAVEFVILLVIAFIPRGTSDGIVNVTISFLCAMQVESFRKVDGAAYASTMCTGNLRSGTEALFHFIITKKKEDREKGLKYFGIILFFISGAILGTILSHQFAERAVLFCCALLLVGFCVMFRRKEQETANFSLL